MKNKLIMLITILAFTTISCSKNKITDDPKNFIKFSSATTHVANKKGSTAVVKIQSDVAWKLTIENPQPDWMMINKYNGVNCDSIQITTLTENTTRGYKFANITATAVNNSTIPSVSLTVVQYDSTVKIK
jgi:hypothetical protein